MTIHTNTTDRNALVKAIADELHTEARYLRAPTYAYEVGDFTVDRDGNIIGEDFTPLMGFLLRNGSSPKTRQHRLRPRTRLLRRKCPPRSPPPRPRIATPILKRLLPC